VKLLAPIGASLNTCIPRAELRAQVAPCGNDLKVIPIASHRDSVVSGHCSGERRHVRRDRVSPGGPSCCQASRRSLVALRDWIRGPSRVSRGYGSPSGGPCLVSASWANMTAPLSTRGIVAKGRAVRKPPGPSFCLEVA
jgi:hypothetical protein